eukprot:TRINITY_DN26920_c0_g1_i1.p1 TRINITY_DN26920_c0_g1~~TRINITY_DN26920_c0_g1_i1.p1  ORF type:complete len:297 (-),score=31.42 TRINITY_DN26920_c0_g1_i1:253-1143(-)
MGCAFSKSSRSVSEERTSSSQSSSTNTTLASVGQLEECPICLATGPDVEPLPHKSAIGDVSQHRACRKCREQLVTRNSSCPWCRTEMVWQTVFGFLDGLKKGTRGYQDGQHNELAGLMAQWQEYEMCRTESDVKLFAREMASDPAVAARIDGALRTNSGWLRDSAGLWFRFYGMCTDGDIELSAADAARLKKAVEKAILIFKENHGGHPHFVGAIYQQAVVAVLCANMSGLKNHTVALVAKEVGEAVMQVYNQCYKSNPGNKAMVRERLEQAYVEAASEVIWGTCDNDPILGAFFS